MVGMTIITAVSLTEVRREQIRLVQMLGTLADVNRKLSDATLKMSDNQNSLAGSTLSLADSVNTMIVVNLDSQKVMQQMRRDIRAQRPNPVLTRTSDNPVQSPDAVRSSLALLCGSGSRYLEEACRAVPDK